MKKKRRTRRDGKPRKKSTKKKETATKKKPAKKKTRRSRRKARPGIDYIPNEKSGSGEAPRRRRSTSKSGDKAKKPAAKEAKAGEGDKARVRLGYAEKKESRDPSATAGDKVSSGCRGGSLVEGINCVTKMMDQAGGGGLSSGEASEEEKLLKARLEVFVTPELVSADDGATYKVTLDVGAPNMNVPRDLKPRSRLQALSDIAIVMARLRQWSRTLNARETKELKEQGTITRPLVTPFGGLRRMRLVGPVNLTVRLREEDMEIRLRFVRAVEGGFAPIGNKLRYGQQFFVEARFKNEPEESEKTVRLFYDDLPGARIKVARTADDKKLYRSGGYHLMYGYHDDVQVP